MKRSDRNKSLFYWKFHFDWLCFHIEWPISPPCRVTLCVYPDRMHFLYRISIRVSTAIPNHMKMYPECSKVIWKMRWICRKSRSFRRALTPLLKPLAHTFRVWTSYALAALYTVHQEPYQRRITNVGTIFHWMCTWSESTILMATNLVCNIDSFSAHRLHSLQLQYHLHFNARLENSNSRPWFRIHLPK